MAASPLDPRQSAVQPVAADAVRSRGQRQTSLNCEPNRERSKSMNPEKPLRQCRRLRCWMTTLGVTFFVLAAACEIEAAFHTYRRAASLSKFLGQSSVTPDAIRMNAAGILQDRG